MAKNAAAHDLNLVDKLAPKVVANWPRTVATNLR